MNYTIEELLPVVKKLSEKFTGKESTSVTYEIAEYLMEAVIYCIREYQESVSKESEKADTQWLERLEKMSAGEAYENGYKAVISKVKQTKVLYEEIMADFKWYGNRALYDTVALGIPAFFLRYDVRFRPQDHILTLDYPVLKSLHEWCGVDAVYEYLCCIRMEGRFLSGFSEEMVIQFLEEHHADHQELFINLPSIVAQAAVQNMISVVNESKESEIALKEKRRRALALLIRERFENDQELLCYIENGTF